MRGGAVMKEGDIVRLMAAGGEEIVRVVVGVRPGVLLVTTAEEYAQARRDRREPACVGFPVEYAVERLGAVDGAEAAT